MTTAPSKEPLVPGQEPQRVSLPLHTAGAAALRSPRPAVITLPDAIDITNDGQLQDVLTGALDDGTAVLVADASGTVYCACAGVTALLLTHHRAVAAGAQLRVVAASPAMRRILELTGADQVLDIYPTLAMALAD